MMALLSQHNQVEFGLASIVFIPYCQIKIFFGRSKHVVYIESVHAFF